MTSVTVNGEEVSLKLETLAKVTDLVELVKSMIDPDHMITSITVDGRNLTENEWSANPNQIGAQVIEIETGTPESYIADRLGFSGDIVNECRNDFGKAREGFQDGKMQEANKQLAQAVQTLQAFFEWYAALVELVPAEQQAEFDLSKDIEEIAEVCKQICQQQLYQSWWALGESLKNNLEPKLEALEQRCRSFT